MSSLTDKIIADIRRTQAQQELAHKMGNLVAVRALQQWQCERLLYSHQALSAQHQYKAAMAFFVDELYGPKDFSQRDADIARVVPKLAALLPEKAIQALGDAIALNTLSFDMDLDLVHHLQGDLNAYSYATAYRAMGRLSEREQQLSTIAQLGHLLADVVHIRGVKMLIKLAKKPAKIAGLLSLHEFLERGFSAFQNIGDVNAFIEPIVAKEQSLMYALHDTSIDLSLANPIPDIPNG